MQKTGLIVLGFFVSAPVLGVSLEKYAKLEIERKKNPPPIQYHYSYSKNKCLDAQGKEGLNPKHLGECGDLSGENLAGKDFAQSNLRGADLRESILKGAKFVEADLRGANFEFSNYKDVQWQGALFSEATVLPFSQDQAKQKGLEFLTSLELEKIILSVPYYGSQVPNDAVVLGAALEVLLPLVASKCFEKSAESSYIESLITLVKSDWDFNLSIEGMGPLLSLTLSRWPGMGVENAQKIKTNLRKLIDALVARPVKLDYAYKGNSPLSYVAFLGEYELVQLFLEAGANINFDMNAVSPLHRSIQGRKRQVFDLLLAKGADANRCALQEAAYTNDVSWLATIKAKGGEVNKICNSGMTALGVATNADAGAAATWSLSNGADPNLCNADYSCSNLRFALQKRNSKVAEALLKAGARANWGEEHGYTLLHDVWNKQWAEMLLKSGATTKNVNLALLLQTKQTDLFVYLLQQGADINRQDADGNSFTHLAVKSVYENAEWLKIALGYSVDVQLKNKKGETAFAILLSNSREAGFFRVFLEKGADPNTLDSYGRTLLMLSCSWGNQATFDLALKHGADIHLTTSFGYNAFSFAVTGQHLKPLGLELAKKGVKTQGLVSMLVGHNKYVRVPPWIYVLYMEPSAFAEAMPYLVLADTDLKFLAENKLGGLYYALEGAQKLKVEDLSKEYIDFVRKLTKNYPESPISLFDLIDRVWKQYVANLCQADENGTYSVDPLVNELVRVVMDIDKFYPWAFEGFFLSLFSNQKNGMQAFECRKNAATEFRPYLLKIAEESRVIRGIAFRNMSYSFNGFQPDKEVFNPDLSEKNLELLKELFADWESYNPKFFSVETDTHVLPHMIELGDRWLTERTEAHGAPWPVKISALGTAVVKNACAAFHGMQGYQSVKGGCLSPTGLLWSLPQDGKAELSRWGNEIHFAVKHPCQELTQGGARWRHAEVWEIAREFKGEKVPVADYWGGNTWGSSNHLKDKNRHYWFSTIQTSPFKLHYQRLEEDDTSKWNLPIKTLCVGE